MSISKKPMVRYQILDNCFRHPLRKFFIEDLINECNIRLAEINGNDSTISRRQVLEDIKFMESSEGWSIPLERHKFGKRFSFRYSELSFSINNSPLNDVEMMQFKTAVKVLNSFTGLPQFAWLNDIFNKLTPLSTTRTDQHLVSFDNNKYLKGLDHFGQLFNAMAHRVVLNITYRPFDSEIDQQLIFYPYYLKEYNNRWFVLGRNAANDRQDWNLALDRIVSLSPNEEHPYILSDIDWFEYFDDLIGVTKPEGGEVEKIKLLASGRTCHYILTKPIHWSQKARWTSDDKQQLEIELSLIINTEFERLILSYGAQVEVITPISLRKNIYEKLTSAISNYDSKNAII